MPAQRVPQPDFRFLAFIGNEDNGPSAVENYRDLVLDRTCGQF